MPPLIVPNAALVRIVWSRAGLPYAINVLGFRKIGAITVDQSLADAVGGVVKAAFTSSALAGQISNEVTLASVGVRDISSGNLPEFVDSAAGVPGTAASIMLPPQVALCCTLRTAQAGKSFRGRYYQPGYGVASNVAGGLAGSASRTTLEAFISALRTNLVANGLQMAVVSRLRAQTTDVTISLVRDAQWDTIRGRATAGV